MSSRIVNTAFFVALLLASMPHAGYSREGGKNTDKQSRVRLKGQITPKCELKTETYRTAPTGFAPGRLEFTVDCNTGAQITVRSKYGVLRQENGAEGAQVAYDAELYIEAYGDSPLLSASGEKLKDKGVSAEAKNEVPYKSAGRLNIKPRGADHPERLPSGRYTDQVTVTITPQGA